MRAIVLFLVLTLQTFALQLIEPLRTAKAGDYFLYGHKKNRTLVIVRSVSKKEILFDEIHAPLDAKNFDVGEWLSKRAPGHTSWIEVCINSSTGAVKRAFCRLRCGILPKEDQQFTTTLLSLPFQKTPHEERRRCGAPQRDNPLPRHLWEPPTPLGLKKVVSRPYVSHWPKDASELAGGRIEVYMVKGSALPAWIEVRKANLKEHIRLIAVGHLDVDAMHYLGPLSP